MCTREIDAERETGGQWGFCVCNIRCVICSICGRLDEAECVTVLVQPRESKVTFRGFSLQMVGTVLTEGTQKPLCHAF